MMPWLVKACLLQNQGICQIKKAFNSTQNCAYLTKPDHCPLFINNSVWRRSSSSIPVPSISKHSDYTKSKCEYNTSKKWSSIKLTTFCGNRCWSRDVHGVGSYIFKRTKATMKSAMISDLILAAKHQIYYIIDVCKLIIDKNHKMSRSNVFRDHFYNLKNNYYKQTALTGRKYNCKKISNFKMVPNFSAVIFHFSGF